MFILTIIITMTVILSILEFMKFIFKFGQVQSKAYKQVQSKAYKLYPLR